MKKILCGAMVLLAAVAGFTSCNKNKGESAPMTLTLNLEEFSFSPGDAAKKLTVKTSTGKVETYVWETSDPEVVTVKASGSSATINAIGYGEAIITVSLKSNREISASCAVKVINKLEGLSFERATIGQVVMDSSKVYAVQAVYDEQGQPTGDSLYAYLASASLNLLSKGFTMNNEGEWVGADKNGCYMARLRGYVYALTGNLNPKYIEEESDYVIWAATKTGALWETKEQKGPRAVKAGRINESEYVRYMKMAFEAYDPSEELPEEFFDYRDSALLNIEGSVVSQFLYNEAGGYYFESVVPRGIVISAATNVMYSTDESLYMYSLKNSRVAFKPFGGGMNWGLDMEEDEISGRYIFNSDKMIYEPDIISIFKSNL